MNQTAMDQTFIICNPAAGEWLAAKRWVKFKRQLEDHNLAFDYQVTEYPSHATEIAGDLIRRGYKRIAVFGGDGTINETIQGLAQFGQQITSELQLLYFPAGSSCDFARKFPDGRSLLDRFTSNETSLIDICLVECLDRDGQPASRYFINNSSIGVISAANNRYNNVTGLSQIIKRLSVDLGAIMAGLGAIREFTPYDCRIRIDGEEWSGSQMSNVTVFKTPYFGGGMNYGIECIQDNGLVDVVLLEPLSRLRLLAVIPTLYLGSVLKNKAAHHWQCQSFEIDSDQDICIETDGEIAGYPPARYSVMKQAIRVVI
ncbi:MAG: diacylglycerol kinase family protein [Candidatus Neomarinimicrobiota bacterium]